MTTQECPKCGPVPDVELYGIEYPEVYDGVLAVLPPLVPEGMTAERLREIAGWIGVKDQQDDLRRWADALDSAAPVPESSPDGEGEADRRLPGDLGQLLARYQGQGYRASKVSIQSEPLTRTADLLNDALGFILKVEAERDDLAARLAEVDPENDEIARLTEDQGERVVAACARILACDPDEIDGEEAYEEVLTLAVERAAAHAERVLGGYESKLAALPEVPDGHEVVVLPREVVTWVRENWCGSDNAVTPYWVEVRAPRAAAATERVQAWEAVRDGRRVVGASSPFEAHYVWRSGPNRAFIGERTMDKAVLVAPDGTVEVLRRDGES